MKTQKRTNQNDLRRITEPITKSNESFQEILDGSCGDKLDMNHYKTLYPYSPGCTMDETNKGVTRKSI